MGRISSKRWRNYEIELIRELWGVCSVAKIASYLEVSPSQVYYQAKSHKIIEDGVRKPSKQHSSKKLDQYVREYLSSNDKLYNNKNATRSFVFDSSNSRRKNSTLCWDCKKSDASSNCPWANYFHPVPGWNAVPTTLTCKDKNGTRLISSYHVISCPLAHLDGEE